jgi:hypothetical protein
MTRLSGSLSLKLTHAESVELRDRGQIAIPAGRLPRLDVEMTALAAFDAVWDYDDESGIVTVRKRTDGEQLRPVDREKR